MPSRSWYDSATGRARPFGSEWEWQDAPVAPELMVDIADKIVRHAMKHDYGMRLSPSRLTATPRQVIIEKFMDTMLDPEDAAGKHLGVLIHAGLERRFVERGYTTEKILSGRIVLGGVEREVVGIPDAHRLPDGRAGDPHIVEVKTTSSGSMRFILEAGAPREDHIVQVSLYAQQYAQTYSVPIEDVRASIRYYCIPQKERLSIGGWTRMPPSRVFHVTQFMSAAEIDEHVPGYSPPTKSTHYQGPPPDSIGQNAISVTAAFERIAAGETPQAVLESLSCMCDRKFNGTGREYCDVMRDCAMLVHGVPYF